MKNLFIKYLCIIVVGLFVWGQGCKSSQPTSTDKSNQVVPATSQPQLTTPSPWESTAPKPEFIKQVGDTMYYSWYDTLPRQRTITHYHPKAEMIEFFKEDFVKDMCLPGDYAHPAYVKYMQRAKQLAPQVMDKLIALAVRYPDDKARIEQHIGNVEALRTCQLEPFPVYNLTPNLVLYTPQTNLTQFYSLQTDLFHYKVMKDNKLVEMLIRLPDGFVQMYDIKPATSAIYELLLSQHRQPIGMSGLIYYPGVNMDYRAGFVYLQNNQLTCYRCSVQTLTVTTPGEAPKTVYKKTCGAQVIDAWWENANLDILIEQAYEGRKQTRKN